MSENVPAPDGESSVRDPASPPEPLPYEEATDERFATAASAFQALPTHGGVVLRGPCPRCWHVMDFPHVDRVYRRALWRRAEPGDRSRAPQLVRMICTCTADHAGRPQDEYGCGAYWNLTLETVRP